MTFPRTYTLAVHLTVLAALFITHTTISVVVTMNGGGTTRRDALLIGGTLLACWAGVAVSYWLHSRSERHRSNRLRDSLNTPRPPSRLTVWTPPTKH